MVAIHLRRRVAEAATLLLAALLLIGLVPAQRAEAADPSEVTMRTYVNQERLDHDRGQLHMGRRLVQFARHHSREMARNNRLYHSADLRRLLAPASVTIAGENVGVGASLEELHQAFMDSPPHRRNLLNDVFNRVGVGMVVANGRMWITVVFSG